jgi:hypothetical protein
VAEGVTADRALEEEAADGSEDLNNVSSSRSSSRNRRRETFQREPWLRETRNPNSNNRQGTNPHSYHDGSPEVYR